MTQKTGADVVVETLVNAGVEVCFTNPGTTEMCIVDALDKVGGMRPVLGLFEGVVSGAADGYARMAEKPACTLMHLGPGMANGIANFHNAARAHSPIVNLIGDHATWLKPHDPPLNADVAGYARPFSGWYRESNSANALAQDAADAVVAATDHPGQIATLVMPANHAWSEAGDALYPIVDRQTNPVAQDVIDDVAAAIKQARHPVFYLNGRALREDGLRAVDRIVQVTGGAVFGETHNPRLQRGAGRAPIRVIPYYPAVAIDMLKDADLLVMVETGPPGSFFAFPNIPATFQPEECRLMTLAEPGEDSCRALEQLAERIAPSTIARAVDLDIPDIPTGALNVETVGQVIAHYLPENAIISDESITSAFGASIATATAQPHDFLQLTGGALGQGMPVAIGAAVACPDRKVICLTGDGVRFIPFNPCGRWPAKI